LEDTDSSTEPKQVIVVRTDLNMRKGKLAAQVAHASMKVVLDLIERGPDAGQFHHYSLMLERDSPMDNWLFHDRFKKIVVGMVDEASLVDLYADARDAKLPCALIVDSGLTEFNGVPTITCLAIGPDLPEKIDRLTGHLKLL
jgi:PTH2 family peptidyl-tRNA hydrolase